MAALVVLALGIWYFTQDDEEEIEPTPTVAEVVATPEDEEVVTEPVDEATPVEVVGTPTDATPVAVLATPVDDATPVAAVDDEPVDEATPVEVIATPVDDVATPPDAIAVDATPALEQEATPEIVVAATPVDATPEAADEVTIAMRDIFYEPNEFTIPANTDVTVILPNEGAAEHDFNIDELDIDTDPVPGGQTIEIVINAPAGEYEFYCSVPGHREAGMVGTLIVE